LRRIALIAALLVFGALAATAQDDATGADENGFIINLLTNAISAPGREVSLSGVSGALSSRARIERIRISDDQGPWLQIDDVEIDWSRAQLLLGRVNIARLAAGRIAVLRRPEPPDRPGLPVPTAEATPFELPELPVSVRLNALEVERISLAEDVVGQSAELSLQGRLTLAGGALDTALEIDRLNDPGGTLDLEASFSNESRALTVDLRLQEPPGGLVASVLRIEGNPAIDLQLSGAGPLDDVDITLSLDADGNRVAAGLVSLRGSDAGLGFTADISGEIAPLIPSEYRDFFAGETSVSVRGLNKAEGGLRVETASVQGAVIDLNGRLETGPDGFLRSLDVQGSLGDPAADPVVLPVPGADTTLVSALLRIDYGGASRWDGLVVLDRLTAGGASIEDLTLEMGGVARNLEDPEARTVTVALEGLATGVSAEGPDMARALGDRLDLFVDAALPAGGPIELRQAQLSGNDLSVFAAGTVEDLQYAGRLALRMADIAVLEGLAGRPLGGAVALRADGSVSPLSGGFDLTFDGSATDLNVGDARANALLAGETELSGRAVRDAQGFRTEDLRVENPQVSLSSDGRISSRMTDFGFDARLSDLALIDQRVSGALTATGRARGEGRPIDVSLTAEIPEGTLMQRDIRDLSLGFDGSVDGRDVTGNLTGGGELGGLALDVAGDVTVTEAARGVSGLRLAVGPNALTGALSQDPGGPIEGSVTLDAPDIAPLAALALTDASGSVEATAELAGADGGQQIDLSARVRDLRVAGNSLDALDLEAEVRNAFGVPRVRGDLTAQGLVAAGLEVASLRAEARQETDDRTAFSADARLAVGTLADLSGVLERQENGFAATLQTLRLRQDPANATLREPATVTVQNGTVTLTPLALDFGTGSLTAQGRVADTIDVSLDIETLPLDLANTIRPDLGLAGSVSGTARVTGPRDAPDVRFDLSGSELAAEATRSAGLPAIAVEARGQTAEQRLQLDASVIGSGLSATAAGAVPLGAGALDLDVDLEAFPLALIDQAAGNQGLSGTVTGQAAVTGTLADPAVDFSARGNALSARATRDTGLPAVNLTLEGGFANQAVTMRTLQLSGPPQLTLSGSGRIPLAGPGLEVSVNGGVPLRLLDPVLEQQTIQATGLLNVDASASGSLTAPRFAGNLSLAGGTVVYPAVNIRFENVALDAGLNGTQLALRSLTTEVAAGGSISASGAVTLEAAGGFPTDLDVQINQVRYTDGAFVNTRIDGALSLRGPVLNGGTLSGRIDLGATEISVAEGLGANAGAQLDAVQHIRPPPRVRQTLERAEVGEPGTASASGSGNGLQLDIRINAPNQIFVRGRGLDAELGGALTIQGTTSDIQPVGQFELRRGRLNILTQRIDFTEGELTLVGDLDPRINLVARSQSGDVTAFVTVSGRVSDPEITFTSQPPLPEDEVLAQLLFGRSPDNLSAFQLAQLAAAAAELAGRGGPGILSQLRSATGLDNLDIVTEESGATAVRAGRYISENAYVDVQTDTEGVSRAEIVVELSERITARGSVGSDGNSLFGLFYERDY